VRLETVSLRSVELRNPGVAEVLRVRGRYGRDAAASRPGSVGGGADKNNGVGTSAREPL